MCTASAACVARVGLIIGKLKHSRTLERDHIYVFVASIIVPLPSVRRPI